MFAFVCISTTLQQLTGQATILQDKVMIYFRLRRAIQGIRTDNQERTEFASYLSSRSRLVCSSRGHVASAPGLPVSSEVGAPAAAAGTHFCSAKRKEENISMNWPTTVLVICHFLLLFPIPNIEHCCQMGRVTEHWASHEKRKLRRACSRGY